MPLALTIAEKTRVSQVSPSLAQNPIVVHCVMMPGQRGGYIAFIQLTLLIITFAMFDCLSPVSVHAQPTSEPRRDTWVPDGMVSSIILTNEIAYIGGTFSTVGPTSGSLAGVDPISGLRSVSLPHVSGTVRVMVSDGTGGLYLAGEFNQVGTHATTNIAHVKSDHTVDSAFQAMTDGRVFGLVFTAGRLFVAGEFSTISGQPRTALAELDPIDGSPKPLNFSFNGPIKALVGGNNRIYFGGYFTEVGGVNRACLAAIELADNSLSHWRVDCLMTFYSPVVHALAIDGDRLFVGGLFNTIGGIPRKGAAAVDPQTGAVYAWDPHLGSDSGILAVEFIGIGPNLVFMSGGFEKAGNDRHLHSAAVRYSDGSALPWNLDIPYNEVRSMATLGNTFYLGGSFPSLGTNLNAWLVAVDANSGVGRPWNPNPSGEVSAIVLQDDVLYLGGDFGVLGGARRKNLAAINLKTGESLDWKPVVPWEAVSHLHRAGSSLFVAGSVRSIDGIYTLRMGKVSLSDPAFAPTPPGDWESSARYIESFLDDSANSVWVRLFDGSHAIVDTASGALTPWNPVWPNAVSSAVSDGQRLYVSGTFSEVAGMRRSMLAAFDLKTHELTDWAPTLNYPARLYHFDRTIVAIGDFINANGQPRRGFAAFDSITGHLSPLLVEADGAILNVSFSPNAIYLAGDFYHLNGLPRRFYGAIDRLSGAVKPWNPQEIIVNPTHRLPGGQIVVNDTQLLVAGTFLQWGVERRENLAVFALTNPPPLVRISPTPTNLVIHIPSDVSLPLESNLVPEDIVRVDTLVDGTVMESSPNLPKSLTWRSPSFVGNYAVSAVAYDRRGEYAISPSVSVQVKPPVSYVLPGMNMVSPTNGGVYAHDTPLLLDAGLVDPSNGIELVEFMLKTNQVYAAEVSPWTLFVDVMPPGLYTLQARAEDRYGIQLTNPIVNFRINRPPSTTLNTDSGSLVVYVGSAIGLRSTASDRDGSIVSVQFLKDGELMGQASQPPFSLLISNAPVGEYAFQSRAVDDFGAETLSRPLIIKVINPPPANDNRANSAFLTGTAVEGSSSNRHATPAADDPDMGINNVSGNTTWWSWVAPWAGKAVVTTRESSFDTVLGVYSNTSSGLVRSIAINDDESSSIKTSRIEFDAIAGRKYQFMVDGKEGQAGDITIRIAPLVRLSGLEVTDLGLVQMKLTGQPHVSYLLEFSSDLEIWSSLGTYSADSAELEIRDTRVPVSPHRFYRISVLP